MRKGEIALVKDYAQDNELERIYIKKNKVFYCVQQGFEDAYMNGDTKVPLSAWRYCRKKVG